MIGIFDSGVGGLSVWREVAAQLPDESIVCLADQAHVPDGPRPRQEIRAFSEAITRFLLKQGCRIIVVACNTASAAALKPLRAAFPDVPFVGMEPAVKPAAPTGSGQIYRHGVEIAVSGSYLDLLAYLKDLEKLPNQLYWGKLELSAAAYPQVTLKLSVYTLSLNLAWLVV